MRVTLAIYITLFAVALVAVAQILYWKLVIARDGAGTEAVPQTDRVPDLDWLREQAHAWVEFEVDETERARLGEPLLVGV